MEEEIKLRSWNQFVDVVVAMSILLMGLQYVEIGVKRAIAFDFSAFVAQTTYAALQLAQLAMFIHMVNMAIRKLEMAYMRFEIDENRYRFNNEDDFGVFVERIFENHAGQFFLIVLLMFLVVVNTFFSIL